ncbi:hypothetical protein PP657_gp007 [Bacillus phage BCPST]|uniref:Uncharacterized protein n=1 Tax=Bacillus phage BCPST TaxID=2801506 RepID=A0AAE7TQV7_9CAUD|nr:hypothetical protein PP657_gp007 [Bacillus phage BCPST]QQO38625.1 hypothetical protein BCPST_007 [Bacillus phage BCPST]QSJ04215.1 hypothetical protein BCP6_010 [Bacillus phage BCP6]WEM05650.1 hypothetical protein BSG01_011 [Bacillus phage BSG01]
MKKLFSTIKKVALTVGLLAVGYIAGNIENEQPQVQAETKLNQIESGQRNVFSQYFKITKLDDKGADVVNRYNENDTYYINKEEFNIDFEQLEVGEPVVVTFDHDTTIDVVYDKSLTHQYKLVDAKDFNIEIDESKYILGIDNDEIENTVVLERDNHKKGDIVNVTFEDDIHDNITKVVKIGTFDEYEDSFNYNAEHDPNKDNPDYVQTEDGSFVPKSFYEGGNE